MNISRIKYALLTLVVLILSVTHVSAQIKWNSAYQAYIDQYKDLAIEQMLKYNIPASITRFIGKWRRQKLAYKVI